LEQLHGSDEISPALASSIELYVSERTVKVLRSLSIESLQHLVEYDRLDLESDMAEHHLYDLFVLMEVAKVRDKYEPYLKQHQVDEE
jgi:hypothetical protein